MLKDPLLHFLLIGASLFAANAWVTSGATEARGTREIRLTRGDVAWIQKTWSQQRQREPDDTEMRGLVSDYLREMLLAAEGRELGLEENDPYIRRRLAQKVEFLVQDASRIAEPTDAELQAFYVAHPDRFLADPLISFEQVFFSAKHASEIPAALGRLNAGADRMTLGDPIAIEPDFRNISAQVVEAQFGDNFATAIFALDGNEWHGPIESAYGLHVVRISSKTPAQPSAFEDVKTRVADLWRDQRQREDNARHFAELRQRYRIVADEGLESFVAELNAAP